MIGKIEKIVKKNNVKIEKIQGKKSKAFLFGHIKVSGSVSMRIQFLLKFADWGFGRFSWFINVAEKDDILGFFPDFYIVFPKNMQYFQNLFLKKI